jgi:hypothetical protein
MLLTLLGSLVCLALWVTLTFVRPVGLGIVHLLWGASAVLWIRWWALKPVTGNQ